MHVFETIVHFKLAEDGEHNKDEDPAGADEQIE